jgi:HAD superfamily hydrolase (TIGR01450 family)
MVPAAVALDLDGVVWRAATPIAGSVEAIASLRAANVPVVFVTNNAGPRIAEHEAKLAAMGVPAVGAVLNSPMAAGLLLRAGERVLVAGGPGIAEATERAGATPVTYAEVDAGASVDVVMVGFDRQFDWERLRIASTAIRDTGARFIATNVDTTYPTESGLVPGAGSLVAAVAAASGVQPIVAGKPYEPSARLLLERCGPDGIVIGDRDDTDGALARACGWRFGLVLSGVTTAADLPLDPAPDVVADDLAALVAQLFP